MEFEWCSSNEEFKWWSYNDLSSRIGLQWLTSNDCSRIELKWLTSNDCSRIELKLWRALRACVNVIELKSVRRIYTQIYDDCGGFATMRALVSECTKYFKDEKLLWCVNNYWNIRIFFEWFWQSDAICRENLRPVYVIKCWMKLRCFAPCEPWRASA